MCLKADELDKAQCYFCTLLRAQAEQPKESVELGQGTGVGGRKASLQPGSPPPPFNLLHVTKDKGAGAELDFPHRVQLQDAN